MPAIAAVPVLIITCIFSSIFALDMSIITYDAAHSNILRSEAEVADMYEDWLVKHGKSYNAIDEKEKRFEIFKSNLDFVDQHNADPESNFNLGINKFADLTNDEFRARFLGVRILERRLSSKRSDRYTPSVGDESLPDSVDWRKEGAVVEVKDQGDCGKSKLVNGLFSRLIFGLLF